MNSPNLSIDYKNLLKIFIIFILSSLFVLMAILKIGNLSFIELSELYYSKYYTLEKNVSYYISPLVNFIFLMIILLTTIIGSIISRGRLQFKQIAIFSCSLGFGLSIVLQSIFHFTTFRKEYVMYSNKSVSEKIYLDNKINFPFSEHIRAAIHQPIQCNIITDLDFSLDKYMSRYIYFRYYMYPIDVHFDKNLTQSCAIYFWKKNASQHILEGFSPIVEFTDEHILTMEKE